jgi:GTP-binding protein
MDSNPLERERGITILSKHCSINYDDGEGNEFKINIIDTPGHADFGGEVERVLKMADGAMLLVDAFEGPMPQTRFVLSKALEHKLKPIVVINKIDRPNARPDEVVDEVFDLLVSLDADDDALDFPIIFSSAKDGWASAKHEKKTDNMKVIIETIVNNVPAPQVKPDAPLQMLVTSREFSDYVGKIAIGRVYAGQISEAEQVTVIDSEGRHTQQKVMHIHQFHGLGRKQVSTARAGDICAISGLEPIEIGDTIACADNPSVMPKIAIDEPTMTMTFRVNDGPFAGQDGKFVTSRQIGARLEKEQMQDVALKVEEGKNAKEFEVSGRGLMHLGILLENMRREGYEVCVGKPNVILKIVEGRRFEPIELLVIDCPLDCQSSVMSLLGERRSKMVKMENKGGAEGFVHMEFMIPSRGLFGLNARMLTATKGKAVMHHRFEKYEPVWGAIPGRTTGVMIATTTGTVTAYALDSLYDRGIFFVEPGEKVYEGQVVGEHNKDKDIPVNVVKGKQLTNVRASGKDDSAKVRAARKMSLEASMEYIEGDEFVEVCPNAVRIRKSYLREVDRKRYARK